jgi:hypothetical protein
VFGKVISFSLLAVGGGGGASTEHEDEVEAVRPRSSLTVLLMVIGPAAAPVVSTVALAPFGVRRPAVALWV